MHIQHVAITVSDLDKSIEFYETVTELKVTRRHKSGGSREVAFMTNGEGETDLELVCTQDGHFSGKGIFICFRTDRLEEKHRLVKERGLNPSDILSPNEKTRYFYVYDPNGVSVQLRVFLD